MHLFWCHDSPMSASTPVSLTKSSTSSTARRRLVLRVLCCLTVAGVCGALLAWEPWVDRSPFTARTYGVLGEAMFVHNDDGTCSANDSGPQQLLGEDGQPLAEGNPEAGEILPTGDLAGRCLISTEYRHVPAGEDSYFETSKEKLYAEDGKRLDPVELSESDLRKGQEETRKYWLHFKTPSS